MRRIVHIVFLFLIAFVTASHAQNPFDLKWRTGATNEPTPEIKDTPATSPLEPEVIDTAVAEMINPGLPDTMIVATLDSMEGNPISDSATLSNNVAISDGDGSDDLEGSETEVLLEPETPIARAPIKSVMIIVMLGLAILILTWSVNYNRGFLRQIYRAAMNENLSSLLLREQRFASSQFLYYIVYITFFINAALFLYLISRQAVWDFGYTNTPLLYFVLFVTGVYLTKHLVMSIIGMTFEVSDKTAHYNFTIILFNILAGIALIPVNLLLAFGADVLRMPVIYIGLTVLGMLYLLRQFRGLVIASDALTGNGFQFFIYLCAVEILPVLVLFKFFITD